MPQRRSETQVNTIEGAMDESRPTSRVQTWARDESSGHACGVLPTNPNSSLQRDATNAEFRHSINLLTELVAYQVEHGALATISYEAFRIVQFIRLSTPMFSGMKVEKDPQGFIDEMEKIFRIIYASKL